MQEGDCGGSLFGVGLHEDELVGDIRRDRRDRREGGEEGQGGKGRERREEEFRFTVEGV